MAAWDQRDGTVTLTLDTTKLLIDQHGQHAILEAALKADELLDAGDFDGQTVRLRIRAAVLELLKPVDGVTVH